MSTSTAPNAREAQRWPMGRRMREIEQHPDGSIYLEDQNEAGGGRLLRLCRGARLAPFASRRAASPRRRASSSVTSR